MIFSKTSHLGHTRKPFWKTCSFAPCWDRLCCITVTVLILGPGSLCFWLKISHSMSVVKKVQKWQDCLLVLSRIAFLHTLNFWSCCFFAKNLLGDHALWPVGAFASSCRKKAKSKLCSSCLLCIMFIYTRKYTDCVSTNIPVKITFKRDFSIMFRWFFFCSCTRVDCGFCFVYYLEINILWIQLRVKYLSRHTCVL